MGGVEQGPWKQYLMGVLEDRLGAEAVELGSWMMGMGPCKAGEVKAQCRQEETLTMMMQHRVVVAHSDGDTTVYVFDEEAVSKLVRFPVYAALLHREQEYGIESDMILDAVAVCGSLSKAKAVAYCIEVAFEGETPPTNVKSNVESAFDQLVAQSYLTPWESAKPVAAVRKRAKTNSMDPVYSINHAQFTQDALVRFVLEYIESRVSPRAYQLAQMLAQSKEEPQAELAVYDAAQRDLQLSRLECRQALEELRQDTPAIVEQQSQNGRLVVNYDGLVENARQSRAQSIMVARHGKYAGRIFRILCGSTYMSETTIAQRALLSEKICRTTLYKMLEDRYVCMQELPRTADRNPKKTLFLWAVPEAEVFKAIESSFYFTWCRLRQRLEAEREQRHTELAKWELFKGKKEDGLFTPEEQESLDAFQGIEQRIHAAMLKLDESIMLFRDFNRISL